jgi:hypothetical protein
VRDVTEKGVSPQLGEEPQGLGDTDPLALDTPGEPQGGLQSTVDGLVVEAVALHGGV